MVDDIKAKADGITQKLYHLMGDAGALNNMVTASVRADWRTLATVNNKEEFKHHLLMNMHHIIASKAKETLPVKTTDSPLCQEYRTFGFVFSEEQLINLLYHVYRAGFDDNRKSVISANMPTEAAY